MCKEQFTVTRQKREYLKCETAHFFSVEVAKIQLHLFGSNKEC